MRTFGRRAVAALAAAVLSAGCVSVQVGQDLGVPVHLGLRDPGAAGVVRRAQPLVESLLIQAQPGDALADTQSIAYARAPGQYGYYQLASWTERPVRQLPRLLQRRLEARGLAGAVGQLGDPLRSDWALGITVDTVHHDVQAEPGEGRVALTADLYDRRTRARLAHRSFVAAMPAARADSAAAAQALSEATGRLFDELLPWLEVELGKAAAVKR